MLKLIKKGRQEGTAGGTFPPVRVSRPLADSLRYWSSFLVASPEGVVGLGDWKTVPGVKGLPGLVPENSRRLARRSWTSCI